MNKINLEGRKAVVTGGARGIGYAICQRLTASGAHCIIWDRDEKAAHEAARTLPGAEAILVDVTSPESVEEANLATSVKVGGIDILVNNAGIAGCSKKLWECTPEEWQEVLQIDLFGVYLCCRALVPGMIASGYGRVVNIASIAGKEGNPNASHYSAAKAGVIGLTKTLGKELANTGITVNCVTPAAVRTAIFDQMTQEHVDFMLSKIPMGRFGEPEEIAALVTWLCSSECSFSTGATFDLSGGRATY